MTRLFRSRRGRGKRRPSNRPTGTRTVRPTPDHATRMLVGAALASARLRWRRPRQDERFCRSTQAAEWHILPPDSETVIAHTKGSCDGEDWAQRSVSLRKREEV